MVTVSLFEERVRPVTRSNVKEDLTDLQREIFLKTNYGRRPAKYMMARLTDRRNLLAAWDRVARSDGADTPGPDGQTCAKLASRIGIVLEELAEQLVRGEYRPGPYRQFDVPKDDGTGGIRTLTLLNVRDRIVHAALKQVLEPVLEPTFDRRSFGYRPGQGVARAAAMVCRALADRNLSPANVAWVAKVDVRDCFGSIDVDLLLGMLGDRVSDGRFLALVKTVLYAGAKRIGWLSPRHVGILQGSPLSPLLCNLYLHPMDEALGQLAASEGTVSFFRYADDLLLIAGTRRSMWRALHTVHRAARKLRLRTTARWWRYSRADNGFEWLGLRFVPRRKPWFEGTRYACEVPEQRVLELIEQIDEMTMPPSERIEASAFDLGQWIKSLNTTLKQWAGVYRTTLNAHEVFLDVDDHVFGRVERLLRTVLGLSRAELRKRHLVRLPGGFRTWEVDGVQLTVLGTLRPHRYENVVVKPAWMVPEQVTADGSLAEPRQEDDDLGVAALLPPSPPEATMPAGPAVPDPVIRYVPASRQRKPESPALMRPDQEEAADTKRNEGTGARHNGSRRKRERRNRWKKRQRQEQSGTGHESTGNAERSEASAEGGSNTRRALGRSGHAEGD